MRPALTFLFLLFTISCFSQAKDTLKTQPNNTAAITSFVTKLNIANATKDGIYLNGYVVNISYEKAKKLNGKKIRVTGKVTIIKGIKNSPGEEVQGRQGDTKHIESPKVEIIKG
jgi:hypothetical protein